MDEDEITIEELRDYFQGIQREDLGLPETRFSRFRRLYGGITVATGPQSFSTGAWALLTGWIILNGILFLMELEVDYGKYSL